MRARINTIKQSKYNSIHKLSQLSNPFYKPKLRDKRDHVFMDFFYLNYHVNHKIIIKIILKPLDARMHVFEEELGFWSPLGNLKTFWELDIERNLTLYKEAPYLTIVKCTKLNKKTMETFNPISNLTKLPWIFERTFGMEGFLVLKNEV